MTGYINNFQENKKSKKNITMSLRVKDKNFLKNITKYGKKLKG